MKSLKLILAPLAAIAFTSFTLFTGCSKSDDGYGSGGGGTPGTNQVWMQNTKFNPATITVAKNTTITWTNKDGMNHTVTSNSGLFNSGTLNNNATYAHAFDSIGTFTYKCTLHSGMTGTVVVQ